MLAASGEVGGSKRRKVPSGEVSSLYHASKGVVRKVMAMGSMFMVWNGDKEEELGAPNILKGWRKGKMKG